MIFATGHSVMATFTHNLSDVALLMPDLSPLPDEAVMILEEAGEPIRPDDIAALAGIPPDALLRMLRVILPGSMIPTGAGYWKTAVTRLAALSWSIDPDVKCHSQVEIAKAIGRTRASLNLYCVELRDFAGLSSRGGMCEAARDHYAEHRKASWARRHAAQAEGKTLVDSSVTTCKQTRSCLSSGKTKAR